MREVVNKVPDKQKDKSSKFIAYDLVYLNIDVTYLPKINGVKYYLFVAIDRAISFMMLIQLRTRFVYEGVFSIFPFGITLVLNYNELEFTIILLKDKTGKYCIKPRNWTCIVKK